MRLLTSCSWAEASMRSRVSSVSSSAVRKRWRLSWEGVEVLRENMVASVRPEKRRQEVKHAMAGRLQLATSRVKKMY